MEIIFKYAWVGFIVITVINFYQFKNRFSDYIIEKPEREEGYDLIRKNFLIYSLLPWIIVAIGCLSGQTQSIFDYFEPAKLNPFVLLFYFSIMAIWLLIDRFVFFNNGAEFLENHPGMIRFKAPGYSNDRLSKNSIKLFFILALAGGIIGMVLMCTMKFPHP